jgi:DNA-binding HxlR family transcriptional regulator
MGWTNPDQEVRFPDWSGRPGGRDSGAVPGYGQYCPIALAAEVFAERWTPIIVRNLMIGCVRFGEILDGAPGLPRSVLSQRLRRLERDGVVERRDGGYRLTECGHELAEVCLALGVWGARWREVRPEHHDPYLVLWSVSRLVDPATLPRPRVVVRFDLTDRSRPDRYWLVLGSTGSEVCVREPGFPTDGVVGTDAAALVRWVTGAVSFGAAQRAGRMAVSGPGWLARQLAAWGRLSAFADVKPVVRAATPTG